MDQNLYNRLLQAEGGSIAGGSLQGTTSAINFAFFDSPNYRVAKLNGNSVDIHVDSWDENEKYTTRTFLFRPDTLAVRGDLVEVDSKTWIVMDSNPSQLAMPSAKAMLCNHVLKWKDELGNIFVVPCATTPYRSIRDIHEGNREINLPQGHMFVLAPSSDKTRNISYKQRFIIGKQVYEITGIDDASYTYFDEGIIYFSVSVSIGDNTHDDWVNGIANNSTLYGGQVVKPTNVVSGGAKAW